MSELEQLTRYGVSTTSDFVLYHATCATPVLCRPDWVVVCALLAVRESDARVALSELPVSPTVAAEVAQMIASEHEVAAGRHPLVIAANAIAYTRADPRTIAVELSETLGVDARDLTFPPLSPDTALVARAYEVARSRSPVVATGMYAAQSRPLEHSWTIPELHVILDASEDRAQLAAFRTRVLSVVDSLGFADAGLFGRRGLDDADERWRGARAVEDETMAPQNEMRERFLKDGVVLSGLARPDDESSTQYLEAWLRYELLVARYYFLKGNHTSGWYRLIGATSQVADAAHATRLRETVDWSAIRMSFLAVLESGFMADWWTEARADAAELWL